MGMNELIRPYRQRVIVESLIKASIFGLFYGLCLTLALAVGFRFIPENKYGMSAGYILGAIGAGVLCALIVGFIIYRKRYNHGIQAIAKRMDQLGLEERVSTMVEYQADRSYVAKVQRDDTRERVSGMGVKALKIKVPKKTLTGCLAIILAISLVFTVYAKRPNPYYEDAQDTIDFLEDAIEDSNMSDEDKDKLQQIIDGYKDQITEDISKDEYLDILDKIKEELKDYVNQRKEIREKIIENLKNNEITKDLADAIESQDPDKIKDALEDLKEKIEEQPTTEEKKEMADKIQDAFEDAIENVEDSEFKEIFEEAIKDLEDVKEELDKVQEEQDKIQEEIDKKDEEIADKDEQIQEKEEEIAKKDEEIENIQKDETMTEQEKQEAIDKIEQEKDQLEQDKEQLEQDKEQLEQDKAEMEEDKENLIQCGYCRVLPNP